MIEDKATEAAKSMARKAYQEFYEDLRNFTRTTISEYIRPQVTLSQGRVEAFSQGGIRIDWPDLEMDLAKPGPSVQMARILESTDAANVLLQAMRSEGETDLNLTSKTEILLMHARQAENLAKDATPPMEASDTITDYYESIADLQVIS